MSSPGRALVRPRTFPPWLVLGVLALPWPALAQTSSGPEFRVNTYTTGEQHRPAVGSDAYGNFVVAWSSNGQDGSGAGIFAQRFNALGVPQGPELAVNTHTTGGQNGAAVGMARDGSFVVLWSSFLQDGNGDGVFGRRFDAAGVPLGGEFQVNVQTTSEQRRPAVAFGPGGSFVVVWEAFDQDGFGMGVLARRFDAAGDPLGGEFQVNTYTLFNQVYPAVASRPTGEFVVVWKSGSQDGEFYYGIFGRRFDATGTPQGGEFLVNTYTTHHQRDPRVAMDKGGNFVVAWQSFAQDGHLDGVFAQRFDASGSPVAGEFRVHTHTTSYQSAAAVAADGDGNFLVTWQSMAQDGDHLGVFAQQYDAAGAPEDGEFRVNTQTTGRQRYPAVAAIADGDFVVAWQGSAQDGDGYGVFAQRYGDLIFKDGVETSDFMRWSSVVSDGADLAVSGAAALAGTTAGIQAFVDDTSPLFVRDDSPQAEDDYRARFYFDPNGFDPGEADNHRRVRLLIAFNAANQRLATIVLRRIAGAYAVMGRVRLDDGSRTDTGFFPVTDAPHFVELRWRRSSGPLMADGSFLLRIDDVLVSTLAGLDNDASPVDYARMGAMSIKSAAAGTLFFDEFESRRQRRIGPE